jgi:D-hydroxyproline dehydrogenase subunit gamma
VQRVQLEVPTHLLWEARGMKKPRGSASSAEDRAYLEAAERSASAEGKVEVTLDGEKRFVRAGIPIAVSLFEMGQSRPEDVLLCPDGSCRLCQISVDGVRKLACQTPVHKGMAIRRGLEAGGAAAPAEAGQGNALCPCMGITAEKVAERVSHGRLQSPEAVLSALHVGEGKCHGQLCMSAFRRVLLDQGLEASQWIDWRFPWTEWVLARS